MSDIQRLKEIIEESERVVFFGGAGVSTPSGIPDFRSSSDLYREEQDDGMTPEEKLHISYLVSCPEGFFKYYRENMLYLDAEPNDAHRVLDFLEKSGKLSAVITQNIDGLHQMAGSESVIELHGSVHRNYCMGCGRKYGVSHILSSCGVPRCESCGGIVRPDVVLYGEMLDSEKWGRAEELIYEADALIVAGTSLTVYPAAGLVECFEGEHLVIINKSPTPFDYQAELVIDESVDSVLKQVVDE